MKINITTEFHLLNGLFLSHILFSLTLFYVITRIITSISNNNNNINCNITLLIYMIEFFTHKCLPISMIMSNFGKISCYWLVYGTFYLWTIEAFFKYGLTNGSSSVGSWVCNDTESYVRTKLLSTDSWFLIVIGTKSVRDGKS